MSLVEGLVSTFLLFGFLPAMISYIVLLIYAQLIVRNRAGYRETLKSELLSTLKPCTPVCVAHRGGSGIEFGPENTMYSYKKAVREYKTHVLEIDLHLSRDGSVVLCHDPNVSRTTNGIGYIRDMDLKDLKKLDAGHNFRQKLKSLRRSKHSDAFLSQNIHSYSDDGNIKRGSRFDKEDGDGLHMIGSDFTIPTFEEVLEEFASSEPNLYFFLDFKQKEAIRPALKIIQERNLENRIFTGAVFPSVNKELLHCVREMDLKVPVTGDIPTLLFVLLTYWIGLFPLITLRHDIIGFWIGFPSYYIVPHSIIKAVADRGRFFAVFGPYISDADIQREYIINRCDMLVTDRSDVLLNTVDKLQFSRRD